MNPLTPPPAVTPARPALPRRTSSAFTLVELLIAMVLIAALTAIALPALANVRRSTWRPRCMNSLRQLCLLTISYADDQRALPIAPTQGRVPEIDRPPPVWI